MENTITQIQKNKIIAICRGIYNKDLINLAKALIKGGVNLIEITYDQSLPNNLELTSSAINLLNKEFEDDILVGAGTVLTDKQLEYAYKAGAKYIISPNTNMDIIKKTKELNLVSIPGAMTPSEILTAHNAGADFVKIFPSSSLGLSYMKDIMTPINHVKFIAAGGVTPQNINEYLDLGFCGFGISSYLTNKNEIKNNNFDLLTKHAKELTSLCK